jgi:hypothetical protein
VYFLAYQELFALTRACAPTPAGAERIVRPEDLEKVVTAELLNLHRGQGLDLLWRDTLTCPTEEAYVSMVNNKTGGLFRLAVKLLMACAATNARVDYIPLVNLVGVYFQIRDDYLNLESTDYEANKGFAEDLTEGKFSFPIVHAIRSDTTNRQVLSASTCMAHASFRGLTPHPQTYSKNGRRRRRSRSTRSRICAITRARSHTRSACCVPSSARRAPRSRGWAGTRASRRSWT